MPAPRQPIRTAARAVVIHEGRLLAVKMRDQEGVYYILPGGGQEHGETLHETVRRECLEEVGVEVTVEQLLYVREYIGANHTFNRRHKHFHQLEHVFRCHVADPHATRPGTTIDNHQIDVAWLDLAHLDEIRFYPEAVKRFFQGGEVAVSPLYLGDCN
ncbi:MAG: NUDIX domain-containing protein [Opitutales bacterium]